MNIGADWERFTPRPAHIAATFSRSGTTQATGHIKECAIKSTKQSFSFVHGIACADMTKKASRTAGGDRLRSKGGFDE